MPWLVAYVHGSQSSAKVAGGNGGPDDVIWAPLPGAGMALVLGRDGTPFHARERRQAAALARIVDTRFRELSDLEARRLHPSCADDAGPARSAPVAQSRARLDGAAPRA